jgi:hypothetical protein
MGSFPVSHKMHSPTLDVSRSLQTLHASIIHESIRFIPFHQEDRKPSISIERLLIIPPSVIHGILHAEALVSARHSTTAGGHSDEIEYQAEDSSWSHRYDNGRHNGLCSTAH